MENLRFALRGFRRDPFIHVMSIVILAVAIGANTAVFSIVNSALLRPLPFPEAQQLVTIGESRSGTVGDGLVSLPVLLAWQNDQALVRIAAFVDAERILAGDEPVELKTASVSRGFFEVLGEPVVLGHAFAAEEDDFGASRTVILGHSLWKTHFGADSTVIGRMITIEGTPYAIVGVASPSMDFPTGTQLWTPLLPSVSRSLAGIAKYKFLNVVGRLGPGVTAARASEALAALSGTVPLNSGWSVRVKPLSQSVIGDTRRPLLILMAAVVLVLLIACGNVGNLLLARSSERAREFSIRLALGASPSRITKALLVEHLLVVGTAGVIGTLLGWGLLALILRLTPGELLPTRSVDIDFHVLAFALVVTLASSAIAGVASVARISGGDMTLALRDGGPTTTGVAIGGLSQTIVIGQVALTLVLLTGAGLLTRSFLTMVATSPGFRTEHLTAFEFRTPSNKYGTWSAWHGFYSQLTSRLRAMPGVVGVATARNLPLSGKSVSAPMVIEGRMVSATNLPAQLAAASPHFFETMGLRVTAGRDFNEEDENGTASVAIINERFARLFFPNESPLGKKVRPFFGGQTMRQIIGIVTDVHQTSIAVQPEPVLYTLAAQDPSAPLTLVVRSNIAVESLITTVRGVVHDLDPDQPIKSVVTIEDRLARSMARPRFYAGLVGGFAAIALALALLGLHAVMERSLVQRRQELAVRMALGANGTDVFKLLLRNGASLVLGGVAIGLLVTIPTVRVLSTLLFGIRAMDATSFGLALASIFIVTTVVIARAGWRAAESDPMLSLRR